MLPIPKPQALNLVSPWLFHPKNHQKLKLTGNSRAWKIVLTIIFKQSKIKERLHFPGITNLKVLSGSEVIEIIGKKEFEKVLWALLNRHKSQSTMLTHILIMKFNAIVGILMQMKRVWDRKLIPQDFQVKFLNLGTTKCIVKHHWKDTKHFRIWTKETIIRNTSNLKSSMRNA